VTVGNILKVEIFIVGIPRLSSRLILLGEPKNHSLGELDRGRTKIVVGLVVRNVQEKGKDSDGKVEERIEEVGSTLIL